MSRRAACPGAPGRWPGGPPAGRAGRFARAVAAGQHLPLAGRSRGAFPDRIPQGRQGLRTARHRPGGQVAPRRQAGCARHRAGDQRSGSCPAQSRRVDGVGGGVEAVENRSGVAEDEGQDKAAVGQIEVMDARHQGRPAAAQFGSERGEFSQAADAAARSAAESGCSRRRRNAGAGSADDRPARPPRWQRKSRAKPVSG